MIKEIQQIFEEEAKAIKSIPVDENFEIAIQLIHERVHQLGGKLIASGMGKAGQIAANIATTFSSTGTPAIFIHPSEAQHGDLGVLAPNDVLLLLSNSGKTREILELIHLSSHLHNDLKYIVITSNSQSEVALLADVCIGTGNPKEVCPLGLTPSTSTTVMTVIGDALVAQMMRKINFTSADYSKRHHGGYLGEISRKQAKGC